MKPLPQNILNWIQETLNRLFIKQPKYFKYWSWLSGAVVVVCGIPYVLVQFNIHLPEPFATLSNKAATAAATVAFVMSMLAVKAPTVGQTEEGSEIKVTNDKKMPFTANAEKKEVEKAVPPVQTIPNVPEGDEVKQ